MRKNAAMFLFLESQLGQQNKPACKTKKANRGKRRGGKS